MRPSWVANPSLKHTKPKFSIGKTEVRSRGHWPAWSLLGSKIAFVGHCWLQKIVHLCTLFAFWAHFGPSHEVEGHFKQPLCRFSPPSSKCYIFPTKNRLLLRKNGGYPEVTLSSLSLIWAPKPPLLATIVFKK